MYYLVRSKFGTLLIRRDIPGKVFPVLYKVLKHDHSRDDKQETTLCISESLDEIMGMAAVEAL